MAEWYQRPSSSFQVISSVLTHTHTNSDRFAGHPLVTPTRVRTVGDPHQSRSIGNSIELDLHLPCRGNHACLHHEHWVQDLHLLLHLQRRFHTTGILLLP